MDLVEKIMNWLKRPKKRQLEKSRDSLKDIPP